MAKSNHTLVYQGIEALRDGLKPVCVGRWEATYGDDWLAEVNSKLQKPVRDPSTDDPAFLLEGIQATWDSVWKDDIPVRVRPWVWDVVKARNKVADHGSLYTEDAYDMLRTVERLLEAFGVDKETGTVSGYRETLENKLPEPAENHDDGATDAQSRSQIEAGFSNGQRVDQCLDALTDGLRLKCSHAWSRKYGKGKWIKEVNARLDSPVPSPSTGDRAFLLPGIVATWEDVWSRKHGSEVRDLVTFVDRAILDDEVPHDEAYWIISGIRRILESFKATEDQRALVERHEEALLRQLYETIGASTGPAAADLDMSQPDMSQPDTESVAEGRTGAGSAAAGPDTRGIAAPVETEEEEGSLGLLGTAFLSAGFRPDGSRAETEPEPPGARQEPDPPAAPAAKPREVSEPHPTELRPVVESPATATEEFLAPFEDEPISPYDKPGSWYVIHAYSGYEKKVKARLATRTSSMHMEDRIFEVVIPTEKVVEIKGGRKVEVEKRMFPGYLLIRMYLDDDSWHAVRNTPGVTSFVGMGTGNKPTSLSKREVERFLGLKKEAAKKPPRFRPAWEIGETVRVSSGPFADFNGVVEDINVDRQKVTVLVEIFGRDTPMELGFEEIQKQ